jgi:hypothetical protein
MDYVQEVSYWNKDCNVEKLQNQKIILIKLYPSTITEPLALRISCVNHML